MALYASSLIITSTTQAIPAKNPGLSSASCVILRHPYSTVSLPSNPVSTRASPQSNPLQATQPPKYVYPDPIPEFAVAETKKFREDILRKLSKDEEAFGDDLEMIVNVCAEVFSEFLHKEYGGPGTLLVEPFTEMFVALNEKKLPRPSVAARACLLWAQKYVDEDWEVWNSKSLK
ncbi:hypothetical protein RHSIM_Rhsim12G0124000 [Rhododendron simsii]|uniref:Uncharacterized protein n=1 Tax=Rhododendron simsii TaxID=118357 RepID=A0A834G2Y1_RHOSS|nr:hypothetical protein RHSIM_Rhsim12G0124000 [Rhododendron simsii]